MQYGAWLADAENPLRETLAELLDGFPADVPVCVAEADAGGEIIRQDEACGYVYILLEGRVAASGIQPGCATYAFSEFGAGEFFGEYEVLSGFEAYLAQVRAKTRCRLLRIPAASYMEWVLSDSAILLRRTREVLKGLIAQAERERSFLFLDSDCRLMRFLALYCERGPGGTVTVAMTRTAICEETGFCVRTVNRSIKRLEAQDLLTVRGGKITITAAQLRRLRRELESRMA